MSQAMLAYVGFFVLGTFVVYMFTLWALASIITIYRKATMATWPRRAHPASGVASGEEKSGSGG